MSVFVRLGGRLEHILNLEIALDCPHCGVHSHLTPISIPRYEFMQRFKPAATGIVCRCDSCNEPVFLRFAVTEYAADHVELDSSYEQVERVTERFSLQDEKSDEIEELFNEALACYANECYNAFALMCRRTSRAVFANLGEGGKLHIFDELSDAADLAGIGAETLSLVRRVVFESDSDSGQPLPALDAERAGILLELMKDMLYQTYIRRGRLRRALRDRRRRFEHTGAPVSSNGD